MILSKNVTLFQNRHTVPNYVTDWFFDEIKDGYNPLDVTQLQAIAKAKCLKWQSEGVSRLNIYLSGLTSATIAALNAVWDVGMSARLYHYSFLTDKWMAQPLEFFKDRDPTSTLMSTSELAAWEEEYATRKELTLREYMLFVGYARIFNDVMKEAKLTFLDFEKIKADIHKKYEYVNDKYINMMEPYIDTRNKQEVPYHVRLREAIIRDRDTRNRNSVNNLIRSFRKGGTYRKKRGKG